jgi:hypothetical protein
VALYAIVDAVERTCKDSSEDDQLTRENFDRVVPKVLREIFHVGCISKSTLI